MKLGSLFLIEIKFKKLNTIVQTANYYIRVVRSGTKIQDYTNYTGTSSNDLPKYSVAFSCLT